MLFAMALGAALTCPLDALPAQAREALAVSSRAAADGESPRVPVELRAEVAKAVEGCAAKHGWNADQKWEATGYAMNSILRDELAKIAVSRGVDPAKVEMAVRGMAAAQRSPFEASKPEVINAVRSAIAAQGVDLGAAPRSGVALALARAWLWLLFLSEES